MFRFQTLNVWQKSVEYSNLLFTLADNLPQKYQFSFGEQLRRATLSITNNIAEGSGRKSKKEGGNFYNIAKGSVYETINIVMILSKNSMIDLSIMQKNDIYNRAEEICRMLSGMIKND